MAKRKKRLIKQEKGLLKQAEKHLQKLETQEGEKDTTPEYWKREAERFKEQAKERTEILEKLENKKEVEK